MKQTLLSLVLLILALAISFGTLSLFPLTENPPAPEGSEGESAPDTSLPEPKPDIYTVLDIPSAARYPKGDVARCPWDMVVYDGKIYFGSGDYEKNKGPAEVFCYDPATKSMEKCGTLPDEEVSRFCILDGRLAIPGTDPKEPWSSDTSFSGSYYLLEGDTWVQKRVLAGAIHNFDLIAYKDRIFAGLGVVPGDSPIAVSLDGGESFSPVSLYKGDNLVDTAGYELVRTHDFLVCDGKLYATFYASYPDKTQSTLYELYQYDEGDASFRFVTSIDGVIDRLAYSHAMIGEKVAFDGKLFFTTGYLYATEGMTVFEKTLFSDLKIVADLFVENDTLYLLGSARDKESGKFRTAVYQKKAGEKSTTLLFDFFYDVPAMSLAVIGDDFYIGMGDGNAANAQNGAILLVNLAKGKQELAP